MRRGGGPGAWAGSEEEEEVGSEAKRLANTQSNHSLYAIISLFQPIR